MQKVLPIVTKLMPAIELSYDETNNASREEHQITIGA